MTKPDTGLNGLKVIDLGVGMAPALVAKFLREGGADITRLEPPAGDPFYEVYPAYEVWRRGSTVLYNCTSNIRWAERAAARRRLASRVRKWPPP